jgi:hypothetical protein
MVAVVAVATLLPLAPSNGGFFIVQGNLLGRSLKARS